MAHRRLRVGGRIRGYPGPMLINGRTPNDDNPDWWVNLCPRCGNVGGVIGSHLDRLCRTCTEAEIQEKSADLALRIEAKQTRATYQRTDRLPPSTRAQLRRWW